jgi:hypothetical protein
MRTRVPHRYPALGAVDVSTVLGYASKLPQYLSTIAEVIDDPYLPETACQIDRVYQSRHGIAVRTCNPTAATSASSGVGLNRAIPVLKFVAYAEQNKWVYPTAIAAILGIPFLLGFQIGRGR